MSGDRKNREIESQFRFSDPEIEGYEGITLHYMMGKIGSAVMHAIRGFNGREYREID